MARLMSHTVLVLYCLFSTVAKHHRHIGVVHLLSDMLEPLFKSNLNMVDPVRLGELCVPRTRVRPAHGRFGISLRIVASALPTRHM